ncbi:MAG: hypothetical protein Aurels2KO_54860 [Aureliella sp.]
MGSQIKVRQLEDWIVGVHRDKATRSGMSLEEYLRDLLRSLALRSQRQFADEAERQLAISNEKYGVLPSSVDIIREQREQL